MAPEGMSDEGQKHFRGRSSSNDAINRAAESNDLCMNAARYLILNELHLLSPTQHRFIFNSVCYIYMCATCFGLYLGHPQECRYRILQNGRCDKNLRGLAFAVTIFTLLKYKR